MKRWTNLNVILIVIVAVLAVPYLLGLTYDASTVSTFTNGYAWSGHPTRDRAWQWAQEMQRLVEVGGHTGTGKVFYVDSGEGTSGDGTSWDRAFITLDEAFASGKCTANRGDFVLVAQGHNESLTAADGVDIDVAGVTVIGLGNGNLKPTFDYDGASGEFVIGAANVRIENLRFRVSSNAVTTAISVEDAGDEFRITNCEFGWAETATDEFTSAITIEDNVDYGIIEGCFFSAGGQAAAQAISIVSSTEGLTIRNNTIIGDYSAACIDSAVGTNCHYIIIEGNILFNGTMTGDGEVNTVEAIEMNDNTSGIVVGNNIVSDTATALLQMVADDMVFINNFRATEDGDEFAGQIENAATSITASPSA